MEELAPPSIQIAQHQFLSSMVLADDQILIGVSVDKLQLAVTG